MENQPASNQAQCDRPSPVWLFERITRGNTGTGDGPGSRTVGQRYHLPIDNPSKYAATSIPKTSDAITLDPVHVCRKHIGH